MCVFIILFGPEVSAAPTTTKEGSDALTTSFRCIDVPTKFVLRSLIYQLLHRPQVVLLRELGNLALWKNHTVQAEFEECETAAPQARKRERGARIDRTDERRRRSP